MPPSNRRQCNNPDHRVMSRGPSGNATVCRSRYRLAVQYCSISETCFRFFSSNLHFKKKGPRGFRRRSKSGRKRPLGRAATAGGHRVSYFANPRGPRIDEAQFSAHVSRATVRVAAHQVGGTRTPCSRRNAPATLIASATKRPRVSASASPSRAVILRSNTRDVPLATSAQVNVRARNGVKFGPPSFRPKMAQPAALG